MKVEIDEKINARRLERQKLDELTKVRVKEVLKIKPAYKKIEERFHLEYEIPSFMEKKK